jgi:hypothetical protein
MDYTEIIEMKTLEHRITDAKFTYCPAQFNIPLEEKARNEISRNSFAAAFKSNLFKELVKEHAQSYHEEKTRWIPIEERCPTKEDSVNGKVIIFSKIENYYAIEDYTFLGMNTTPNISWQPLPQIN